ncbi:peptide chain release factor N(5)-glutamine methyltransferase [Rheinheimera riviphila]|uniref:Release factor glutamine methyltransferase n=2 Tax=Rheinheimera riviphila TaxID=1834037 RepID=A0A437Q9S0_9GAMM|nr:peptide chain release factor N(5)-glutamine methyltransferase [Rheinheimera riviphila]
MTTALWLQQTAAALLPLAGLDVAISDVRLEARRLLGDVLEITPTALQLRLHDLLSDAELALLADALQRRLQGEPLAYITGRWWFWDLELEVAPCTLIPRPDTELLVEQALALSLPTKAKVLDLGTGTGAIALALAKAKPDWQLYAVDFNADAVALAQRNQQRLQLHNCQIFQSDWFSAVAGQGVDLRFDLIVSNPPYIDAEDPHLQQGDVKFEPLSALVAPMAGLADLQHICQQAPEFLTNGGWLWLEHGYQQAEAVQQLLQTAGFSEVSSRRDYAGQWRISGGCFRTQN